MQLSGILEKAANYVEDLGKAADRLKGLWGPFPSMKSAIPAFHRQIQGVYERVDAFCVKVDYMEFPEREDLLFIQDLALAVELGIQEKGLLEESLYKKLARNTPRMYIRQTKRTGRRLQKMLSRTQRIIKKCRKETEKVLARSIFSQK